MATVLAPPALQWPHTPDHHAFSDDDSTSDASSERLSSMKTLQSIGSPSSVAEVNEVVRPVRRKRTRMSAEERRVRHRQVQREFMKRKRARIAELRKVQSGVQKELQYVQLLREMEQLKTENQHLQEQLDACAQYDSTKTVESLSFGDLVFSVPSQETQNDLVLDEFEWNELFLALSDDGCSVDMEENEETR